MKKNFHPSVTAGYSMRNRTKLPVPEYAKKKKALCVDDGSLNEVERGWRGEERGS